MSAATPLHAWIAGAALALAASVQAAEGVKLPPVHRAQLANGAQVALVEKRDTPLVAMTITVRGGALGDAPGKEGTASLFADLIQKGSGERNAAQFAEAVETAGGSLVASAGSESLGIRASFMARDVDLMLELAGDALQRPALASDEFEKARTLAIQSIAAAKDSDPRALIASYGDAWLFRGHPYGRPVGGSEGTLAAVTLEDVQRFYAAHVGGDRTIITVVGDIDARAMSSKLERAFGGWRKAGAPTPRAPAPQAVSGRRVLLVDKPGATQTYFWLGNVGASRTDPARTQQTVVNTAFGGRYTSMLNTALRIDSGLTYGVSAGFDRASQPGAYQVSSYTQTESTVQAVDLALATLERLRRDALDAPTLASAKSYLLGQFPPTLETNGQLAGRLADLLFYGLGPEDVDEYAQRVAAVDAAAVRSAIERAFPKPADLAIVLIGDADRIRAQVGKYGPVTEMKITDPHFAPPRT
ncbi:MAG TPA: pitrilysin family protein [Steroidobacteraceae bacterium]|nr:pitrilysin family protein [Steroidobacteraceae bacterium]